jgi:hypothetical protein
MAHMNEGFSRCFQYESTTAGWSLLPLGANGESALPARTNESDWAPAGPGWFDSSWLLHQGLEVTELCSVSLLDSVLRALQMQSPPNENVHPLPA